GGQFFDQIVVYLGVHLGLQDLFCAQYGKRRYLATQLILGTIHFLLDFSAGASYQTIAFGARLLLGFLNHCIGLLVGLLKDLGSLSLGLAEGVCNLLLSQFKVLLRTACGVQTFCDFLLALLHGLGNRRPYELHARPDENSEGERLTEQRQVNVHSDIPRAISFDAVVNSTATGPATRTPSGTGKYLGSDNEDEVHRDTDTDHRYGVEQAGHQEGLGLQLWSQL